MKLYCGKILGKPSFRKILFKLVKIVVIVLAYHQQTIISWVFSTQSVQTFNMLYFGWKMNIKLDLFWIE